MDDDEVAVDVAVDVDRHYSCNCADSVAISNTSLRSDSRNFIISFINDESLSAMTTIITVISLLVQCYCYWYYYYHYHYHYHCH